MSMIYSSAGITVSWAGEDLSTGWADDTFLTIEPLSERKTATFGSDGQMTISRMANKGATISLTLKQTSSTNKAIARIAALEEVAAGDLKFAPFMVQDLTNENEAFYADNAVLTEVPSTEYGNAVGEKTWVWVCETYVTATDLGSATSAAMSLKARFS